MGLVLAGGRSQRMGRDKAALPWRGHTLLAHMQQVLRDAGIVRVLISGGCSDSPAVADQIPHLGPLGGLASVAATLSDCALLVVPVDAPLTPPALLRHLQTHALRLKVDCACFHQQPLPLWLRLNATTRQALARLLAGPAAGRSLRALHAALHGRTLPLPAAFDGQLRDADTPEDWRALSAENG